MASAYAAETVRTELNTRAGTLTELLPMFIPETRLHSSELTTKALFFESYLRDKFFYSADIFSYVSDSKGNIILHIGRRHVNSMFNDIDTAVLQLENTRNYTPTALERLAIRDANSTLTANLSECPLTEAMKDEISYFEISTRDPYNLHEQQLIIAQAVFGGDLYDINMRMHHELGTRTAQIYVLNPDYVKAHVNPYQAIVRISVVINGESTWFGAYSWNPNVTGNMIGVLDPNAVKQEDSLAQDISEKATEPMTPAAAEKLFLLYGLGSWLQHHQWRGGLLDARLRLLSRAVDHVTDSLAVPSYADLLRAFEMKIPESQADSRYM